MPTIQANGINIYHEIHGQGNPLVLIAGIGYDHWMWHKMASGLAKHFQVVLFDNRGIGKTDKPPGPYTAELLAADTAALLEALGAVPAAVFGHSMGGFIAQALALNNPDVVDRLILSATNFGGPRHIPTTPQALAVLMDVTTDPVTRFKNGLVVSTAPGFAEKHPEIISAWLAYRAQNPIQPESYQAQLAIGLGLYAEESCFEHRLKAIQARTLILFGEHDNVVPPENAHLLAAQIANSQIHILPGAGHFFPLEAPAAANEVVIRFLQGNSETSDSSATVV